MKLVKNVLNVKKRSKRVVNRYFHVFHPCGIGGWCGCFYWFLCEPERVRLRWPPACQISNCQQQKSLKELLVNYETSLPIAKEHLRMAFQTRGSITPAQQKRASSDRALFLWCTSAASTAYFVSIL